METLNLPSWPNTLPLEPLQADYQETYTSLAKSVTTGNKSLLIRRNSTRAQDKMKLSYVLYDAQVAAFEKFYYDTLAGGTRRFTIFHPRKHVEVEVSFDPTGDQAFTVSQYNNTIAYKIDFTLIIWS